MAKLPPPRLTVRRLFNDYQSLQDLLKNDLPLFPYGVKASDEDLPRGKERKTKRMKKLTSKTSSVSEPSTTKGHAAPFTVPSPELSSDDLYTRMEVTSKPGGESKPNRVNSFTIRGDKPGKVKVSLNRKKTEELRVPLPTRKYEIEGPDPERLKALLYNPLPRAKTQKPPMKPEVEPGLQLNIVENGSKAESTGGGRRPKHPWRTTAPGINLPDFGSGHEPDTDGATLQGMKKDEVKTDTRSDPPVTVTSRNAFALTQIASKQYVTDVWDFKPSKSKLPAPFAFVTINGKHSKSKIPAPFAFMTINDKPYKPSKTKVPPPVVASKTSTLRSGSMLSIGSRSMKNVAFRDKPTSEAQKQFVSPWVAYQEFQAKKRSADMPTKPALSKFGGPIAPPRVKKPTIPYDMVHLYVKRRSMILPSPSKFNKPTPKHKELTSASQTALEQAKIQLSNGIGPAHRKPTFVIHDRYFTSITDKAAVGAPIPRSRLPPSRLKSSLKPTISISSMSVCSEYSIASGASSHGSTKKSVTFVLPEEEEELRASGKILTGNELRVKWVHYNENLGTNWWVFRKEFPKCMLVRILDYAPKVKLHKTMPAGPILALIPDVKMNENLHRVPWHHKPSPFPETEASRQYGFQRKVGIMNPLDYHVPFKITENDILAFGVIRP